MKLIESWIVKTSQVKFCGKHVFNGKFLSLNVHGFLSVKNLYAMSANVIIYALKLRLNVKQHKEQKTLIQL